jgi:hypothetical protein
MLSSAVRKMRDKGICLFLFLVYKINNISLKNSFTLYLTYK